jgi:bifunctional DNA-binding transcriptional regulator/antitoxin component of YhaV-PrlF toxin-antitoxin module
MHTFTATLRTRHDGEVTLYFVDVPDVEEVFGRRGQVWIRGLVNGVAFETTLLPRADGGHYLILRYDLRQRAGLKPGDEVEVAIEENPVPRNRELPVPEDLTEVLDAFPEVKDAFGRLSKSRRFYVIEYIESAKKPETRMNRIEKSLKDILRLAKKNLD